MLYVSQNQIIFQLWPIIMNVAQLFGPCSSPPTLLGGSKGSKGRSREKTSNQVVRATDL